MSREPQITMIFVSKMFEQKPNEVWQLKKIDPFRIACIVTSSMTSRVHDTNFTQLDTLSYIPAKSYFVAPVLHN